MPLRPTAARPFALLALLAAALVLVPAGAAWAQQPWPVMPLDESWRGPGSYLSVPRIAACWLVFLAWTATTPWAAADAYQRRLPWLRWGGLLVGVFLAAHILVWVIPFFWLAWPLLLIAYVAPLAVYIHVRNGRVEPHQKVLTPQHARFLLAQQLAKVGVTIAAEPLAPHERLPVKLFARGGENAADDNARLLFARKAPGFDAAQRLLGDAFARRAAGLLLDFAGDAVNVKHSIDGVWIDSEPLAPADAQPAVDALKVLCRLNPSQPLAREEARFGLEYESERFAGTLLSQVGGVSVRLVLQWEPTRIQFSTFDALGMRPKMQEQLLEILRRQNGLVLFSAMPNGGLETTVGVCLRSLDRMVRDFASLESELRRYEEIENVPVTTYSPRDKPAEVLARLLRTEPQALVVRDLVDADMVRLLCREAKAERLVIGAMRAKDSVEALLRVLALKVEPAELAGCTTAVLAQRLLRKLCEDCKEPYAPPPQVLQQLGIPPGRIAVFYRPPQEARKPCPVCGGLGYLGRTAIFEFLVLDNNFRKLLQSSPKLDRLRAAAAHAGMPTFQEEGVLLVAKGITSIPEVVRVLKQ